MKMVWAVVKKLYKYLPRENMTKMTISTLIISTLALRALAFPIYVDGDGGDGGGDDTTSTYVETATDITSLDSEATTMDNAITTIPQYNCGYSNVEFDTSLNTFANNDTVWFYGDETSNCGPPGNGKPCTGSMYFTGNYGDYFGYMPYSVWYTFKLKEGNWMVTLYYNYNGGQTSMVDNVVCNGNEYKSTLTRCMFNEDLYSYEFFKYYQFNFYTTCTYDLDTDSMFFNLEQESRTCVGNDGTTNDNRFTQSQFDNWTPQESFVVSDVDEFCPNCVPTVTVTNTATATATETETVTSTPCPTPTPTCVSCGDSVVVNVNVNTKSKVVEA